MNRKAIIYTRVSTDDQADRGYSLPYQEERLRKYCELHNIKIIAHYQDDHSAKTFERPEFIKLLGFCKKNPGDVDLLLFINWSRFSRNAADSYAMINQLKKLSIDPQAIEQPLDLSIPENKMMLAFYLAAPEVENDRRSANVLMGMYRAKKEGRWTGKAPLGYKNIRGEDGRATIIPDDNAEIVQEAFEQFSSGAFAVEELRRKLVKKGLKCERARFPMLLRNLVYVGKIFVPAYKEEPAHYTKSVHEPIVSEEVFERVQDILEGRKPNRPTKNTLKGELPLRGYLECRICGNVLTGSASRGNGGKYYYYHCTCGCPERFRAEDANKELVNYLGSFNPNKGAVEAYYEYLLDIFQTNKKADQKELTSIDEEISKNNARLRNAQQMRLDGELDPNEYKDIKLRLDEANEKLIRQKANLSSAQEDFEEYLKFGITIIKDMNKFYEGIKDLSGKQLLISSIFPGKLIYENRRLRTNRVNEAVRLICLRNNDLDPTKNGRGKNFSPSSTMVVLPVQFSNLFIEDLRKLANIAA